MLLMETLTIHDEPFVAQTFPDGKTFAKPSRIHTIKFRSTAFAYAPVLYCETVDYLVMSIS